MTIEQVVRQVLVEDHADVIREGVRFVAQQMMEAGVSDLVGAQLGERKPGDRATHRNGYRSRGWDKRAGESELQNPEAAPGRLFPVVSDAARALGAGAGGGGPAALCARRLDPAG
jgi:transposase-like protein